MKQPNPEQKQPDSGSLLSDLSNKLYQLAVTFDYLVDSKVDPKKLTEAIIYCQEHVTREEKSINTESKGTVVLNLDQYDRDQKKIQQHVLYIKTGIFLRALDEKSPLKLDAAKLCEQLQACCFDVSEISQNIFQHVTKFQKSIAYHEKKNEQQLTKEIAIYEQENIRLRESLNNTKHAVIMPLPGEEKQAKTAQEKKNNAIKIKKRNKKKNETKKRRHLNSIFYLKKLYQLMKFLNNFQQMAKI